MGNYKWNVFECNVFIFENKGGTGYDINIKKKLFSGAISHGASRKPEAYLEPSQASARSTFAKIVNS